ncbi:MAG TPA: TraX family protein [Steroidobacteraceae bacterium]|nr:TraX family protein [Steroidobacteraceae bacterium]
MTGSRSVTRKAASLSEPAASAGTLASRLFPRGEAIEALKWLGLAAMLVEHWMRYVAGDLPAWAYAVGRLAFPLFVFALALGTRALATARLPAVIVRMLAFGIAAQVAQLAVDAPAGQANILFTFALGVTAVWLLESGWPPFLQALSLATIGVLGLWCEFGVMGVALVAVTVKLARAGEAPAVAWLAVAALVGALALPNRNHFALAAVPLALAVGRSGIRIPRVRRAFYWIYTLQFPMFAAIRMLGS